jgi:Flp pilus assembly protein TadG
MMKHCLLRGRKGATMVEFAMIAPVFALLLFAIIQYGFIFAAYISVRNASAVAARYATLSNPTPTTTQIQSVARGAIGPMLNSNDVRAVNVDLNANVGGAAGAKSVEIQYNLSLIVPFVVPGKTNDNVLVIGATTVMR